MTTDRQLCFSANTGDLAALKDAFSGKDSKSLKKIVLSQQQAIETRMKYVDSYWVLIVELRNNSLLPQGGTKN